MKVYVYVDGESHFIRSRCYWKSLHGEEAELGDAFKPLRTDWGLSYPDTQEPMIRLQEKAKFLWDTWYGLLVRTPFCPQPIAGAVYYTDFSGNDDEYHRARVFIRDQGFDPQVIREQGKLAKHRENRLKTEGILEKPKGVDIGLTVRLLGDSYHHIFDVCYLFTSDVDYVPVIQAIQRVGQKVIVFGYREGLGKNSDLEYVPDAFINLEDYMRTAYEFRKGWRETGGATGAGG